MVAVSMQQSKFMELLQYMLAFLEVSRFWSSGSFNPFQNESNRSVVLGNIGQEPRPDSLTLDQFVNVALFLDVWNLMAKPSDFDDNSTAKTIVWRVSVGCEASVAILAQVEFQIQMVDAGRIPFVCGHGCNSFKISSRNRLEGW